MSASSSTKDRAKAMLNHAVNNQLLELSNAPEKVPFPKSNPAALKVSDPDFITDLTNNMYFFSLNPDRVSGDDNTKALLRASIKAAKTYRFKYNRDNKMPKYLWDKYHLRLRTLTLDHYINSIRKGYGVKGASKALLQGDSNTLNSSSLTADERDKKRLASLASGVIAEHMFLENPNDSDSDVAIRHTNMHYNLSARPGTTRNNVTPAMYDRTVLDFTSTLAKIREICSEVYCWAFHTFSDKGVKKELEQIHESYLRAQRTRDDGQDPEPFTAQIIVDHVTTHYTMDNTSHIEELKRAFETVVRYKKESLHQWLNRLKSQISQLIEAREGLTDFSEEEIKSLWKDTYVGNINFAESLAISHRMSTLEDYEKGRIEDYQTGVFDATFFEQFLLTNKSVLPPFDEPDATVLAFNKARYSQKKDIHGNAIPPPNYNNPAFTKKVGEKEGQKKKRAESANSDPHKTPKKKHRKKEVAIRRNPHKGVAPSDYCTNQGCIDRKAHRTHTTSQCHYRNSAKRHKGDAGNRQLSTQKGNGAFKPKPQKKQNKTHNGSSSVQPKSLPTRNLSTVKCYSCNKMGHYASDCPDKKSSARFSKESMGHSKHSNFKTYMTQAFPEKDLRSSAMKVVKTYGLSCCHQCGEDECRGNCDEDERDHHDNIPIIMERLSEHPELTAILEETNSIYQTGATYAPLTVQSYFTSETQNQEENFFHDSDEGAGDSAVEDDFFDDPENGTSSETEANSPTDKDTAMSTNDTGDHDQSNQGEYDPIYHYSQTSKGQPDSEDSE